MDAFLNNSLAQLCFNRSEFTRPDFNVELFLHSLRRRASIEQIQSDLRLYLKILQNAMIELINEDYADFVNLSSNLVNLRSTVSKLHTDLSDMLSDFDSSTAELSAAVDQLSTDLQLKLNSRKQQRQLEEQIRLYSLVQKLEALLGNCRSTERVDRVAQLLANIEFHLSIAPHPDSRLTLTLHSLTNSYQHVLDALLVSAVTESDLVQFLSVLRGYNSCGRRDAALAVYIAEFLEDPVRQSAMGKRSASLELLEALFSCLKAQGKVNETFLGRQGQIEASLWTEGLVLGRKFFDDCLFTVLLSVLDRDMGSVLIPTDADTFHSCYLSLSSFVQEWPRQSRLLKMALDKFSLRVYFQLRSHEVALMVDEPLKTIVFHRVEGKRFHNAASEAVYHAIERLWSDKVYLPPLVAKLWDVTCKLLTRHTDWLKKIASPPPAINGVSSEVQTPQTTADWRTPIYILSDLYHFDSSVFELAFDLIWPRLRTLQIDTVAFGQCLSSAGTELKSQGSMATQLAISSLTADMNRCLLAINEVPRQYRWTRKEAPSKASGYIETALGPLAQARNLAEQCLLPADQLDTVLNGALDTVLGPFLENTRNVLVSVDKMSTSLSRLKKAPKQENAGVSDDQKIRMQIGMDLEEFRSGVDRVVQGRDWKLLGELENMAKAEMPING